MTAPDETQDDAQDDKAAERTENDTPPREESPSPAPDPALAKLLGLDAEAAEPIWVRHSQSLISGGAAVAALLLMTLALGGSSDETIYVTEPVGRADISATVTATGSVEPTNKVDVSSELSGTIRRVLADYNATVKKGQTLAELDTDKLRASVDSARAKLVAAEARVKEAQATRAEKKLELNRKAQLVERRIVSVQEQDVARAAFLRADAGLDSARADVSAAKAELKLQETNLAKACICSPIDGIVLTRSVEPGQTVAASLSAPVLFTIAEDLHSVELQVNVDEADVGRVREGQRARFTVDAYPGRRFDASITRLHYGPIVVWSVVTYKAVLATENADLALRPGMTATAEIVVDEVENALTVPNAALRFTPKSDDETEERGFLSRLLPGRPHLRRASKREASGPMRSVWLLVDGAPQEALVKIGATNGMRTVVLEGELEPGMAVIVDSETAQ